MSNQKFGIVEKNIIGFENKTNLKFLDKFIKKHKLFFRVFNLLGVITCLLLFISMSLILGALAYNSYKNKIGIQTITTILPFKSPYAIDLTDMEDIDTKGERLREGKPVTEGNRFNLYYGYILFTI